MPEALSWVAELPAAVTVTDETGTNVFECHPEPARTKTLELFARQAPNHYTISKGGRRKIIHQLPWYRDGVFAGFVEISIPIPDALPHFDRD